MAISTTSYSATAFKVAIAEQDAFGTIEAAGGNAYHALDVDSISSPSLNPIQGLDVRSGSRVLQATDFFHTKVGAVAEISISGTATTAALDMLLENIMGEAEGGASGVYSFLSNASAQSVGSGDTSQTGTLLSLVMISPITDMDIGFKDCVITSLSLSGDAGTEGGRIKFSATFKSGSAVDATQATTVGAVDTAFTAASENYTMNTWAAGYRQLVGVADLIMSGFTLNLTNEATFLGLVSTGYESISRSSEFSATLDATVKYDPKCQAFFENFQDQATGASEGATLLNNDSSLTDANFGISMPSSVITSVAFSEQAAMMLDVSVKAVGAGVGSSTALVEVAC
jgi:hypothetical protein|tara:strand:+ start:641 stop:1666 length:1026 start_codon:yes stop_codon:yes gene_type:complete